MSKPLTVAVAVSLDEESAELICAREPRIRLRRDPQLTAPWRWSGDWEGEPSFARTAEQDTAYTHLLAGADALFGIPDTDPGMLARAVRANPQLRWVHTTAAGGGAQVKAARLTAPELEQVVFTTSAGVHAETLSEWAIFGVLAGAKDLRRLESDQCARQWHQGRRIMRHLSEMTVLIVGLGGIGKVAAQRFSALGAIVWGTTRTGAPVDHVDRLVPIEDLRYAAAQVDAVVVTLPDTDHTAGLLDGEVFRAMRPGTIVVNVGRGTVIDELALLDALDTGRVGFAALDVTATEPLPKDSPLWSHPGVLISPHTAALSLHEPRRIAELFAANATRLLENQRLVNVMSTREFY